MTNNTQERLEQATKLLERAAELLSDVATSADPQFWPDLFTFTGEHMILTDEGWESGESKQSYLDQEATHPGCSSILAEVNAPV